MDDRELERCVRVLVQDAWERDITWQEIAAWIKNFTGQELSQDDERRYALFLLTRFMYFGKRLVREMLRAQYRDYFEAPLKQRIRRRLRGTKDLQKIEQIYCSELHATRFVGLGNPAESGAHLLYYFRQVNRLPKDLFVDLAGAFLPVNISGKIAFKPANPAVHRYVFFDDLVASGTQATLYLSKNLAKIKSRNSEIAFSFLSLFATSKGLQAMNAPGMFNGKAQTLFELDESYKAFEPQSRYFKGRPDWLDIVSMEKFVRGYGKRLSPDAPVGFADSQLLLGFTHNTPDNAPPIFWDEGQRQSWQPLFVRYDKLYSGVL